MPWWGRTKQDSKKKSIAEAGVFDAGQRPRYPRQPKRIAEDDGSSRASRKSLDVASEPGSASGVGSRSPSPSSPSNECCPGPGQPLPLPCAPPRKKGIEYVQSGTQSVSTRLQVTALRHAPSMPLPSPTQVQPRPVVESSGEVDSGSVSSASSLGSIDAVDQWQPGRVSNLRPLQDDPPEQPHPSTSQMGQELTTLKHQQPLRQESSRSTSPLIGSHQPAVSPNRRQVRGSLRHGEGSRPQYLNIPQPDSSISSPAPSPRSFLAAQRNVEPVVAGSGQSSSPRSAATSAYNSSQGDPALVSQQAEEPSPAPSPRLRSPGPSCGTSATVSPLHPRAGRLGSLGPEQPTTWHEEPRGQYPPQPLPLPPPPTNGTTLYPPVPMSSAPSPSAVTPRGTSRALDPSGPGATTRWQKGKLLGSGTFGNVYVGFNNDSGGFCAMKEVLLVSDDSKSNESVKQLSQEIALLSKLRHENIVQYIGTETLEDRLYIYLEYVSGGSIHKLLQEYGAFKEPVTRNYTRQILSGLAYLHNQNTVHRDIKGANILVDTHGIVKLADFGMAKHITAQSFLQSFKGSPYWMAPEVIKQSGGYDLAVDIWSLGCTVLEMVTTKPPWHQYEGVAAMFKIWNSKELPVIPDVLSKEGKDFVRLCLQRNPAHRPSAAQLLEHPFVEDAPRVSGPDVHGSSSDLLSSAATRIQSLNVTPNLGHRLSSSHDVEGPASHGRGRVQQSPTRCREPLSHGHGASVASPSASPRIQSRTVHQLYSGVSTPMMSSGSSTPRGGANGSSPPLLNAVYGALSTFPNGGGYGNDSWTQSGRFTSSSNTHGGGRFQWSITPQRTPEGSPRRQDWHPVDDIPLDLTVGRNNERMIGKYNAKEMEL